DDLEHLSWAKLALDTHRDQPGVADMLPVLDNRIVTAAQTRAKTEWLRPATVRLALTALALATGPGNPFRITDGQADGEDSSQSSVPSPQSSSRRRSWKDRLSSAFRGLAVQAIGHLRPLPPQTQVHIATASDYNADLAGVLRRQYET